MRVLVTGSSTFFGARLIQELGREGNHVTAADSLYLSSGKASRFADRRLMVPRLGSDPEGYFRSVKDELNSRPYDLLLPAFEECLLLAEHQDELRPLTNFFLPSFEIILKVHNKPRLHRLCEQLGIPSPAIVLPRDVDDLRRVPDVLRFPVVIKLPMANNSVGKTVCNDYHELCVKYRRLVDASSPAPHDVPFVQEMIDGELICTLMLCHDGEKLGEVIYRNLRTFPDQGGTSAHRESISHPAISVITERFAAATHWSGFLGLDFIVHHDTQLPYLIDANPRANPAVHLGYIAGVNWTDILFDLARGRIPPPVSARPGVRARSLMLDVAWLLDGLRPGRNWLQTATARLRGYFRPAWQLDSHSDLLGREDRLATFVMGMHAIRSMIKAQFTGQQLGKVVLDDANYDAAAAAEFASRRTVRRAAGVHQRNQTHSEVPVLNEA